MATIHIVSNLTPGFGWVNATLEASKELLAAQGVDRAPLDDEPEDYAPLHSQYVAVAEDDGVSDSMAAKLDSVEASLASGRDVLLFDDVFAIAQQTRFTDFLKRRFDWPKNQIKRIFLMGRPALELEYLCLLDNMSWLNSAPWDEANWKAYCDYVGNFSGLVENAIRMCGPDDVTIIPSLDSALPGFDHMSQASRILATLGVDGSAVAPRPWNSVYFVATPTGSRLFNAMQVRQNDWPRLDNIAYMDALARVEKSWEPEPLSPLSERRRFIEAAAEERRRQEKLMGLPAGSLEAPGWIAQAPAHDFHKPLASDKVAQFVAALPDHVREVLLERYANDSHLLTEDQKTLRSELARANGFSRISDAIEQPTLTVLTMARNHERFIGQCMDSVLAQKTDFPVRHLALDHYSTDDTPKIIEAYAAKYPSIRPVILRNRDEAFNNVRELFNRCQSEYAALCDGDDYFIDNEKLQLQVNFLRDNPDCSISFHPVRVDFEDSDNESFYYPDPSALPRGIRKKYYLTDLFAGNMIQTNSAVYRWRFRDGLPDWFHDQLCPGDWYWHLLHAEVGKIGFIPRVMAVYRRHKAATFAHAFIDAMAHRKATGMKELQTYATINDHFKGRYRLPLARLAASAFNAFLNIYLQDNSSHLFDEACVKFPEFGKYYLNEVLKDCHDVCLNGVDVKKRIKERNEAK